jgi:hypothetical protein
VWQRKVLFENGQNENSAPSSVIKQHNRHHMELEKLTSQRKFMSVAARMASFEKSSDEDADGRENTPPISLPPSQQPAVKVRRVSVERTDSDSAGLDSKPSTARRLEVKTETVGKDEPAGGGGSVRVFVSPNNLPPSSPPVVEIVPVFKDKSGEPTRVPLIGGMAPPTSLMSFVQQQQPSSSSSQPVQVVQPIMREPVKRDSQSVPPEPSPNYHMPGPQRPLSVHEWPRGGAELDWQQQQAQEAEFMAGLLGPADGSGLAPPSSSRQQPQRKSSYLSAVNAPAARCESHCYFCVFRFVLRLLLFQLLGIFYF